MAQMSPRTLSRALRLFAFFAAVLAVIALVFTPTPALAAGDVIDDSAVIVLTTDNFAQKTKSGTWIVEFYAPWCSHCKRFAPKYAKWAQKALQWRDSYNFHVAKVDCVAHKDVCEQNKVVGFPTIYAFVNGERKDEFEDEQTYKAIEKFGTAMVAKYPPAHAGSVPAHDRAAAGNTADVDAKPAKKQADEVTGTSSGGSMQLTAELKAKQAEFVKAMKERTISDLGRYGRVVDLTTDNFEEVTSRGGPWLLEFYAPWCGHCQQLEGTYTQLAEKLKGKMNIARINADDQTELRQRFGIRGYPTLKLYKSGATTDYRGARTLEALEKFALSSVQPSDVRHVTYAEFARLRDEHEVAVVFAYGAKAKTSEWLAFLEAADSWMLPTVTGVYASVDPQFSASNAGEAVVLVYRRGYKQVSRYPTGQDAAASAGDADEDDEDKKKDANKIVYDEEAEAAKKAAAEAVKFSVAGVRKFVHDHRFPLLPELTDHNAEDIMDGTSDEDDESDAAQSRRRRVVVLGILDPKTTADDKERRVLTEVADKVLRESGGRMHGVTVQSVWLNGRVWQDYIQRVYQLSAADLPRVIISVPAHEEFFATGEDGEPIAFTTAAIYDAVEDVVKQKAGIAGHHAKLSSTSTRGRIVSWAKAGWRKVNTLSPGFLLGAVVVSVLGIWFMCCRGGSSAAAYDRLESSKFD